MSSFTCAACGGFKYQQVPLMRSGPEDLICQDCFENGAMRAVKPCLHAVLLACYEEGWSNPSNSFEKWLESNNGEAGAQTALTRYCLDMWKRNYRKITGEEWS